MEFFAESPYFREMQGILKGLIILLCCLSFGQRGNGQAFNVGTGGENLHYQSFGNHVAEIRLSLQENKKFSLYFYSFHDKKMKRYRGSWTKHSKQVRLRFKGSPDLDELFAANLEKESSSLSILDDHTIRFSLEDNGLFIWGVYCFKQ